MEKLRWFFTFKNIYIYIFFINVYLVGKFQKDTRFNSNVNVQNYKICKVSAKPI